MAKNLVGTRIRALRADRGLTQQALAELADIPRATIATIERDDSNPSLAAVYRIAMALETTIDDLILEAHQRVQVIKKAKMRCFKSVDGVYEATVVSPRDSPHFEQQLFRLQAHAEFEGKPHSPGSEEYLHVLEGQLELEVAGEDVVLSKGDSARFGGDVQHWYRNVSDIEAIAVVTITHARR